MASRRTRIKAIANIPQRRKGPSIDTSSSGTLKANLEENDAILEETTKDQIANKDKVKVFDQDSKICIETSDRKIGLEHKYQELGKCEQVAVKCSDNLEDNVPIGSTKGNDVEQRDSFKEINLQSKIIIPHEKSNEHQINLKTEIHSSLSVLIKAETDEDYTKINKTNIEKEDNSNANQNFNEEKSNKELEHIKDLKKVREGSNKKRRIEDETELLDKSPKKAKPEQIGIKIECLEKVEDSTLDESKKYIEKDLSKNNVESNAQNVSIEQKVNETNKLEERNESAIKVPEKPVRRKFLKPTVALSSINRKPKNKTEISDHQKIQTPQSSVVILNQIVLPPKHVHDKQDSPAVVSSSDNEELNVNEINFIAPSRPELMSPNMKVITETHSDSEYPPPPPSPSKINRSRIKAVPRLSQRKTSFSASESEDESRRYNRIRNDSVCSAASVQEPNPDIASPVQKPPPQTQVSQKKNIRSEQARRMAEARRDFIRKFGKSDPEKNKLKMIDLIFYNPASNPMSTKRTNSKRKTSQSSEQSEQQPKSEPEPEKDSESVKNDSEVNNTESDEENDIPVPQIKIGPSGELVLDEKSVVIESKAVKKQKEKIQQSRVVDGDFDTGYGIYKRAERSKDWSHQETLRFYKALNVIGTDFSLMAQLFPGRNRRQLKSKFKKEERLNHYLIDRAVTQPRHFNYEDLRREVEKENEEAALVKRLREEEKQKRRQEAEENKRRRREAAEKRAAREKILLKKHTAVEVKTTNQDAAADPQAPKKQQKERAPKIGKINKKVPLPTAKLLNDSDADVSDAQTDSDSDEELQLTLKPTRSGRMPKVTNKYNDLEENFLQPFRRPSEVSIRRGSELSFVSNASELDKRAESLEPGSVMVVREENEQGELEYKIFMVTPEKTLTALDVDSETISKVVQLKSRQTPLSHEANDIFENNITILEDETEIRKLVENSTEAISESVDESVVPKEGIDVT